MQADFIDTLIVGPHDDLLGWLEYSGSVAGKLPDPMGIRHVEVTAGILAAAMTVHARVDPPQVA